MLKIAIAIGHNFANGDEGALANGTSEAKEVKKILFGLIGSNDNPNIQLHLVPLYKNIYERQEWIKQNASEIDAYFEFHMNASNGSARGAEVFYTKGYQWASEQAKKFCNAYCRATGLSNRGAKNDTQTRHGRLGVLRTASESGVFCLLPELGFIDNKNDLSIVRSRAVNGIMEGIYAIWPEYRR